MKSRRLRRSHGIMVVVKGVVSSTPVDCGDHQHILSTNQHRTLIQLETHGGKLVQHRIAQSVFLITGQLSELVRAIRNE
jgi:hypothetical protein